MTRTWLTAAACRNADPELFFPIGDADHARYQADEARAVCRRCPVREACLQSALDHGGGLEGIWGGTDEHQRKNRRRTIAERRQRQALATSQNGAR